MIKLTYAELEMKMKALNELAYITFEDPKTSYWIGRIFNRAKSLYKEFSRKIESAGKEFREMYYEQNPDGTFKMQENKDESLKNDKGEMIKEILVAKEGFSKSYIDEMWDKKVDELGSQEVEIEFNQIKYNKLGNKVAPNILSELVGNIIEEDDEGQKME